VDRALTRLGGDPTVPSPERFVSVCEARCIKTQSKRPMRGCQPIIKGTAVSPTLPPPDPADFSSQSLRCLQSYRIGKGALYDMHSCGVYVPRPLVSLDRKRLRYTTLAPVVITSRKGLLCGETNPAIIWTHKSAIHLKEPKRHWVRVVQPCEAVGG
jgi:hypothetical protein